MGIPSAVAVMRAARGDAAAPPPPGGEPAYLLYYRGTLDAAELRKLEFEGDVGEPGMWRRLMNGGASLTVEGRRVEVIYRDLDAPSSAGWARRARDASRSTRWTAGSSGCPRACSPGSSRPARRWPASWRGPSSRRRCASPRRGAGATRPPACSRSPSRSRRGGTWPVARACWRRGGRHRDHPPVAEAVRGAEHRKDAAQAPASPPLAHQRRFPARVHLRRERQQRLLRAGAAGPLSARVREDAMSESVGAAAGHAAPGARRAETAQGVGERPAGAPS